MGRRRLEISSRPTRYEYEWRMRDGFRGRGGCCTGGVRTAKEGGPNPSGPRDRMEVVGGDGRRLTEGQKKKGEECINTFFT